MAKMPKGARQFRKDGRAHDQSKGDKKQADRMAEEMLRKKAKKRDPELKK
jgi:hypothetical protein